MQASKRARLLFALGALSFMVYLAWFCMVLPHAHAIAMLVQTAPSGVTNGGTSVIGTLGATVTAGNLIIVICGARGAGTLTGPSGFTASKNEAGTSTAPGMGIFYKIAAGTEKAISCTYSASARLGIQVYEYDGLVSSSPQDAVNGTSSTGTSKAVSSGTVTTANANDLIIAGVVTSAGTTLTSASWTNSFTSEYGFSNGGGTSTQGTYGGADRVVSATGSYSTTVTAGSSAAWRGQIAAFKESAVTLTADIVDASGNSVVSPSFAFSAANRKFTCQTVTSILGASTQKIRVANTTSNPAWTLSMAATNGNIATWAAGANTYDFNDPTGSGCNDGSDADTVAGQLSINPSAGTVTPQSGCTATGVTLSAGSAFNQGTLDSLTLLTGSSSASINCYWDVTGISLSQTIPAAQTAGAYALNLTLTLVAN